jgi:hypothetical protein
VHRQLNLGRALQMFFDNRLNYIYGSHIGVQRLQFHFKTLYMRSTHKTKLGENSGLENIEKISQCAIVHKHLIS